MHDAEGGRFAHRDFQAPYGHVGILLDVLHEHGLVVHFVDMVARQDDDVFGCVALDDVDVLKNGVGGAGVPGSVGDALAGGKDVEALVALQPEEIPAALQMTDQAVGLVLGRHADASDAGIERIRQGKIDNAGFTAEMDRGLGPPLGQFQQAAALTAGEHIGHGRTGKRGSCSQERHDRDLRSLHNGYARSVGGTAYILIRDARQKRHAYR